MANSWSRGDLVQLLGEPVEEWAAVTKVDDLPWAEEVTAVRVDYNTPGAVRFMRWICNPSPYDAKEIESKFNSLRNGTAGPDLDLKKVLETAKLALDAVADNCRAASRARDSQQGSWVLIHVCSRHRAAGLKVDRLGSY
jgi:hypothetical protein